MCSKTQNIAGLLLAVQRESGPNLVDEDSPSCRLLQSAWGGKQHLVSKTRTIPLVFSPSAAFNNPAYLCPLPLLLSVWRAYRPNTWLGLLLWICAVPSSICYLQEQFTAVPASLQGPCSSCGFPWSWLGSLVIFIMQLYSSQNCFLYFMHPFTPARGGRHYACVTERKLRHNKVSS